MPGRKKASPAAKAQPASLGHLTMEDWKGAAKDRKLVLILPLGVVEGHGPHLPLQTDFYQPEHVALEAAKVLQRRGIRALIAPPLHYGNCGSTRNFPGTVSISYEALHWFVREMLQEFVRNGARNIVVLSGHAGGTHMVALREAAREVVEKSDAKIMVLSDYDIAYELLGKEVPEGDGHAGTIETSRIMALKPGLVKLHRAQKGRNKVPRFRIVRNPQDYLKDATNGDPTIANAQLGRKINRYIVDGLVGHIEKMVRG